VKGKIRWLGAFATIEEAAAAFEASRPEGVIYDIALAEVNDDGGNA
jgi:hypothetical protein